MRYCRCESASPICKRLGIVSKASLGARDTGWKPVLLCSLASYVVPKPKCRWQRLSAFRGICGFSFGAVGFEMRRFRHAHGEIAPAWSRKKAISAGISVSGRDCFFYWSPGKLRAQTGKRTIDRLSSSGDLPNHEGFI